MASPLLEIDLKGCGEGSVDKTLVWKAQGLELGPLECT